MPSFLWSFYVKRVGFLEGAVLEAVLRLFIKTGGVAATKTTLSSSFRSGFFLMIDSTAPNPRPERINY